MDCASSNAGSLSIENQTISERELQELHPKIATPQFIDYCRIKGIPELDFNDFEVICHLADGGYGSVFKARRKVDGKLVAMKFFGLVPPPGEVNNQAIKTKEKLDLELRRNQIYIEKEEMAKDWDLNRLSCTAKVLDHYYFLFVFISKYENLGFGLLF